MAVCTAYTAIVVSNAGVTEVNGTYIPYSTEVQDGDIFTIWTKDGANSYPRITPFIPVWAIQNSVPYPGAPLYWTDLNQIGPLPDCPANLQFFVLQLGSGSAPTVTGILAPPTFGLPADVVALITSRFGSVANFLRLRNQGQI
jgi:hypothetical protein